MATQIVVTTDRQTAGEAIYIVTQNNVTLTIRTTDITNQRAMIVQVIEGVTGTTLATEDAELFQPSDAPTLVQPPFGGVSWRLRPYNNAVYQW